MTIPQRFEMKLGAYETAVINALAELQQENVIQRIWQHDHTVWKPDPAEITNRLGWLHTPQAMAAHVPELEAFATAVRRDGLTDVLLLGMGGSSLAPELFYKTFGGHVDGLRLAIVDSTDADAIRAYEENVDLTKTLFVMATKSGGTVETLSAFKYFYNRVMEVGVSDPGYRFVAITDPGSKLVDLAQKYGFRHTFLNDPNIGGRYSVISHFGLLPAALVGVDLNQLLERAQAEAANAASEDTGVNRSAQIGVALGELAKVGRDKVTFITSPAVASFGDWAEQLIAESTGKEGKGILPVVGEPLLAPELYGDDRVFVHLRLDGDDSQDTAVDQLAQAGHPFIRLALRDVYDLGAQFFLWEMATAVTGHRLGIQPFDQPDVESAKVRAREMEKAFRETGKLPGDETAELTAENLHNFLAAGQPGDYIAIHAYVPPTPETDRLLQTLRAELLTRYRLAATVGYGPRFLHSTGQLHKGDAGNGLFIQFISDAIQDAPIPDEAGRPQSSITFGILKLAQALGDAQALRDANRRLIRFHLGTDVKGQLRKLLRA